MLTLQSLTYIEGNNQTSGPIWNYATGTLTSWKGCQPDCVIHLNCGEVHKHASYKKSEQIIQVCVSTLKFTLFRTFKNSVVDLMA